MRQDLQVLERALDYSFRDRDLLNLALTHKSVSSEVGGSPSPAADNEQLEFLGDAVLGFLASEWLVRSYPELPEGRLTVLKARLVSAEHLRDVAEQLNLGAFLRLGHGEEKIGGRSKQRLLANAVEALIAAVYLDSGMDAARRLVAEQVVSKFAPEEIPPNYKGLLAERLQKQGQPVPRYVAVDVCGPVHARTFVMEVRVGDLTCRAEGANKKSASQNAARAMLEMLDAQAQ